MSIDCNCLPIGPILTECKQKVFTSEKETYYFDPKTKIVKNIFGNIIGKGKIVDGILVVNRKKGKL